MDEAVGEGPKPTARPEAPISSRHWFLATLWVVGAGIVFWVSLQSWDRPDSLYQRDFASFWMAGKLALSGAYPSIYDVGQFRAETARVLGWPIASVYAYPPHALFIAMPFALLPYDWGFAVWTAVGAALFMAAARPYWRMPLLLVALTPAALVSISYGQHGFFYGALWLWAFSRRNRIAGLGAAALTFKPHLGLLVAVRMLQRPRALAIATISALALIGVSALLFPGAWNGFLTDAASYQAGLMSDAKRMTYVRTMVPPFIGYGFLVHIMFAAAAVVILLRSFNVFTAATATFLILPYGFHYDMTVVCLGFALLLHNRWSDLTVWQRAIAGLAFLTPALVHFGTWLVPPILLSGLFVQVAIPMQELARQNHFRQS